MTAMPGFKCFTKCVQKTLGIIDDSGKWSPENASKFVSEEDKEVALKVAHECAKEVDNADLCEKAAGANECMRKKNPEVYKRSCVALLAKLMT